MNREQVKQELQRSRTLAELFEFKMGQECDIYKGEFMLSDDIIYIPDTDLNEIPIHGAIEKEEIDRIVNAMYSGRDFLEQCEGNESLAKELFNYCDWQHPSSAWYADFLCDMGEDNTVKSYICG